LDIIILIDFTGDKNNLYMTLDFSTRNVS